MIVSNEDDDMDVDAFSFLPVNRSLPKVKLFSCVTITG